MLLKLVHTLELSNNLSTDCLPVNDYAMQNLRHYDSTTIPRSHTRSLGLLDAKYIRFLIPTDTSAPTNFALAINSQLFLGLFFLITSFLKLTHYHWHSLRRKTNDENYHNVEKLTKNYHPPLDPPPWKRKVACRGFSWSPIGKPWQCLWHESKRCRLGRRCKSQSPK